MTNVNAVLEDTAVMRTPVRDTSLESTVIMKRPKTQQQTRRPTIHTWPHGCGDRDDRPEPVTDVIRRS